jgi:predicted permease
MRLKGQGAVPFGALGSLRLDVKLGVRMLVKYPGLALAGVSGIAVAVAVAAGGFSVIYGNFLAPSLPFDGGDRIVSIEVWDAAANKPERRILHDFNVWRGDLKSVPEIGAFRTVTSNLVVPGARPQSVRVACMSASGFSVARVRTLMGRHLVADDEGEGAPPVIVIGEEVWRFRFGGDPAIVGRTIELGTTPHSIVGVMPEGFAFPVNHQFWVPFKAGSVPLEPLTGPDLMVFGRLAQGATLESAQAELATMGRRSALAFPKVYAHLRPQIMPYPNPFLGIHQPQDVTGLHIMNGVVTTLLVLVCLNVAILVYTRTAMRQGEISIRAALGAGRSRIVVQLFIEAAVLSVVGAVSGVAIDEFALRRVAAATLHIASDLPFWLSFHLSPEAVLYAGLLSVLAAAIVGVVPALQATKRGVQTGGRIIGADASGMRLGGTWSVLVVAQVGFAVALLPSAVFTSWKNIRAELVHPGIAAEEFLVAQLGMDSLEITEAPAAGTGDFTRRYAGAQAELMRRLQADPRVFSTTFAMAAPGDEPGAAIETEVDAVAAGAERSGSTLGPTESFEHEVRFNRVDVNFFRALDVPMLAGRGFEPSDVVPAEAGSAEARDGGAVVVNQSFALRVFRGDALGRRVRFVDRDAGAASPGEKPGAWYEIVGVVRDFPAGVSPGMLDSRLSLYQAIGAGQSHPVTLAVRVRGGAPSTFAQRLSEMAAAVHPDLHLRDIVSLDEALREEQWLRRLEAAVLAAVSLSVLILSSAGIYALMSFTVSQRRKEIGIRMALGANRRRIVASIFSRAFAQLGGGAALGAAFAAGLQDTSGENSMHGDMGVVLMVVALFLMAVGFLAALGPARRCLAMEPTEALREP